MLVINIVDHIKSRTFCYAFTKLLLVIFRLDYKVVKGLQDILSDV